MTGTSYLSSLTVQQGSTLVGSVSINGVPTTLVPGQTYTGSIVVTPA